MSKPLFSAVFGKYMRYAAAVMLAVIFALPAAGQEFTDTLVMRRDCGRIPGTVYAELVMYVTYDDTPATTASVDFDGTLTFYGIGAMKDYSSSSVAPWATFLAAVNATLPDTSISIADIISIDIGNGVTSIGDSAFAGFRGLTDVTIGSGVTHIGNFAFDGCGKLSTVNIPKGVTYISHSAFYRCWDFMSGLLNIEVDPENTMYSSIDGVLFNKEGNALLQYPSGRFGPYVIPDGVTSVGPSAFFERKGLTSVTIPNSVTFFGDNAFFDNSQLASIIILNDEPPAITASVFNSVSKTAACLYVPRANITDYDSANQCGDFGCIEPVVHTVAFNSQGGSYIPPLSVEYGETAAKPANPTRTNYTFDGWYRSLEYTFEWDFDTDAVKSDITLYAKWVQFYAVTFDSEGGTPISQQFIKENNKAVKPPVDPIRNNFIFGGWYQDAARTIAWNFESDVVALDMTLYAKWVQNHTVTFNSLGGSSVAPQNVAHDDKAARPDAPFRSGWSLAGWYLDTDFNDEWRFENDAVISDMILYAKWVLSVNSHEVTFNSQGGSAVVPRNVEHGKTAVRPANPTQPGFIFSGWYREPECTNEWNFETDVVTSAITLYAKWGTPITVTFDSKGGSSVTSQTVAVNGKVTRPANPTQTGFIFDSWYRDEGYTALWNFETDVVPSNITLYARWGTPVTVTFDSQGGSPVSPQNAAQGGKITRPADPVLSGFILSGWYLTPEFTTAWNFGTDAVTSNITLYAKWAPYVESRYVTFNSQGGSDINPQVVVIGGKVTKPANPAYSGYYFAGWYRDTDYTFAWNFDINIVTSDMTLYAKWSTDPVSVLSNNRTVPKPNETAATAPVTAMASEFTAGPNPVVRSSGSVNFFRQGKRIEDASLTVYDASGNVIKRIRISDKASDTQARRALGSWDLTDTKGRTVPAGTYVAKGQVVTSPDGKREKVSLVIGVR